MQKTQKVVDTFVARAYAIKRKQLGVKINMKKIFLSQRLALITAVFVAIFGFAGTVFANPASTFNQTIGTGTLTTDIKDGSGTPVASPSFTLGAINFSFTCQTSTGTFGSSTQRIYVTNPGAANNGWTLTVAPTSGGSALWSNTGGTHKFDYNDASGSGCTDGDADTYGGQMTLNPQAGGAAVTLDCGGSCTSTGITQGSQFSFTSSTPATLLTASSGSDDNWQGYLTGVGISQTIPANTASDSYTLNMTLTATAS